MSTSKPSSSGNRQTQPLELAERAAKAVPYMLCALCLLVLADIGLGAFNGEVVVVRLLLLAGLGVMAWRSISGPKNPLDVPFTAAEIRNIELNQELTQARQTLRSWCLVLAELAQKSPELQDTIDTYARLGLPGGSGETTSIPAAKERRAPRRDVLMSV